MLFAKERVLQECDTVSSELFLTLFRITRPSIFWAKWPKNSHAGKIVFCYKCG
jgi:hypothetical protein